MGNSRPPLAPSLQPLQISSRCAGEQLSLDPAGGEGVCPTGLVAQTIGEGCLKEADQLQEEMERLSGAHTDLPRA